MQIESVVLSAFHFNALKSNDDDLYLLIYLYVKVKLSLFCVNRQTWNFQVFSAVVVTKAVYYYYYYY